MIDPIHNQAYQEYTKVSRSKPQDVEQKFSMDSAMHENPSANASTDGVIYESSDAAKADSNKATSSDSGHAMHSNQKASSPEKSTAQTAGKASTSASSESITDMLKRLFRNALQGIKKFLTAIWESKPVEDSANADTTGADTIVDETTEIIEATDLEALEAQTSVQETVEAEYASATEFDPQTIDPVLDADIKKALKAKDTDSFRALLSQDGHRVPAKNTSLLTYYDSKGNLVNLDPSDQYRILHGDRNSRKL